MSDSSLLLDALFELYPTPATMYGGLKVDISALRRNVPLYHLCMSVLDKDSDELRSFLEGYMHIGGMDAAIMGEAERRGDLSALSGKGYYK